MRAPNRILSAAELALHLLITLSAALPALAITDTPPAPLADDQIPSLWIQSYEFRAWSGYKDNVLLGNHHLIASPLVAGGIDLSFFRIPMNGWESFFLCSGEYIRFLTAKEADQEITGIFQGQIRKSVAEGWKIGLSAEYLYLNQVFDNSTVSSVLQPIPLDGHTFTLRPSLIKEFSKQYRLELEFPGSRQIFGRFIDNYWEFGPKLSFIRQNGKESDLNLAYQFNDRIHDTRFARDADGAPLPDRGLEFYQHELTAAWRNYWDADHHWRTVAKASIQRNVDNGGGYYDYIRPQISAQVRFRRDPWELRAEARVSYYLFDHQRIDDEDSDRREKTYLRFNFRAERSLTKTLKIFGQYEYEQALSNISFDRYSVNTIFCGLDWEF